MGDTVFAEMLFNHRVQINQEGGESNQEPHKDSDKQFTVAKPPSFKRETMTKATSEEEQEQGRVSELDRCREGSRQRSYLVQIRVLKVCQMRVNLR